MTREESDLISAKERIRELENQVSMLQDALHSWQEVRDYVTNRPDTQVGAWIPARVLELLKASEK